MRPAGLGPEKPARPPAYGSPIDQHQPPTMDARWVKALELAAALWAGGRGVIVDAPQSVLNSVLNEGPSRNRNRLVFLETAIWFYDNLLIPPGEGDPR